MIIQKRSFSVGRKAESNRSAVSESASSFAAASSVNSCPVTPDVASEAKGDFIGTKQVNGACP